MGIERGSLSIDSENIFPIIKKWLYSDHDIFYRELVSNGCDAITKFKKLVLIGEAEAAEDEKYRIDVKVDPENKTIKVIDNGLGMTADEVKEYINQIAFSGATQFMEKYKDKANEDQIIGHFGLGFYSSFMVADKVTIETRSYLPDAEAVLWESEGGTEFEMKPSDKKDRGTVITLYLNEDSYEFCNEYRAREVLDKYCSFMPIEIFLTNEQTEREDAKKKAEKAAEKALKAAEKAAAAKEKKEDDAADKATEEGKTEEDADKEDADEADEDVETEIAPKPVNNTSPLWNKHPNECKEDEYKDFYRNVFHDYKEPLFWIHLNMDYPFNLKGILYFPKINTEYDSIEGTIKLYNNQVFIADNIKEVIPEFLMLLKGVIDCPDLPLNVSRSALQNDGFVKKISDYITKKVADKLSGMCKTDRENYEKFWDDISPFIKFGCLKDSKFEEKMKDYIIFKNLEGKYIVLSEYNPDVTGTKDNKKTIYYVTDEKQQSQYINMFKEDNMDAVILTHNIDQSFITSLESKDETITFQRIDAEIASSTKEEVTAEDEDKVVEEGEKLTDMFKKALNNDKLSVKAVKLKNPNVSSMITLSEQGRRMHDMMKMYNMGGSDSTMFENNQTLVLNLNNDLVKYLLEHDDMEEKDMFCCQLYDLAVLCNKPLEPEEMTRFVERSNKIMQMLTQNSGK